MDVSTIIVTRYMERANLKIKVPLFVFIINVYLSIILSYMTFLLQYTLLSIILQVKSKKMTNFFDSVDLPVRIKYISNLYKQMSN